MRLWRLGAGALALAGLGASALNAALGTGGALFADTVLPVFGELVLAGAVVAIGLRAARIERDRWAWVAIGCGVLAWTAGDIYPADRVSRG